ncbi:hypothetical protein AAFF_G00391480 [Aldrovandia affinis]|uniref:Uncharacterized protein n=1 Tax=Aldrovandia affinis TaxID=143900 RepID=A0AAD7SDZ6_9TELE|nr:hypothetical protein AAFF_G00391480 [Aldrovandia affinis]
MLAAGTEKNPNPEPWNNLSPTYQYKSVAVSADYKSLKEEGPDSCGSSEELQGHLAGMPPSALHLEPLVGEERGRGANQQKRAENKPSHFLPRFLQSAAIVCLAAKLLSGARRTLTGNHAGRGIAPGVITGPNTHRDSHYQEGGFTGPR